jgi:hypothetical protein
MFRQFATPFQTCVLGWLIVFGLGATPGSCSPAQDCLPPRITPNDVVSTKTVQTAKGEAVEKVRVRDRIAALKGHCEKGKLVDGGGREIYFYKLKGCWGNPPENYQEILANQAAELESLKKRYTVIEMTCNPSGVPIQ